MRIKVEHINKTTKRLADGTIKVYYYNRKNGRRIHGEPGTSEFANSYFESQNPLSVITTDLSGLIKEYKNPSGPFIKLASKTQCDYDASLNAIDAKFGTMDYELLSDGLVRGQFIAWRDEIAIKSPRTADSRISVLKTVLQFGYNKGKIAVNHAAGIEAVYTSDRSKIVWEPGEIELFCKDCSQVLLFAIQFARLSGLRRADLVSIDLGADRGDHLEWFTSKSRKRTEVIIPVVADLRRLLDALQAHRSQNNITATTILFNSYGRPWTPPGFSRSFDTQRDKVEITKHLHDMRGTFVVELCNANFEDEEISEIIGWKTKDVKAIRRKYVDRATIVQAAIKRLERNTK